MLEAPSFKLNYPTDWLLQIKRVKYPGPYPCPFSLRHAARPEQRCISCLNACGEGVLNGKKKMSGQKASAHPFLCRFLEKCPNYCPKVRMEVGLGHWFGQWFPDA
jgi:hypothetical protein